MPSNINLNRIRSMYVCGYHGILHLDTNELMGGSHGLCSTLHRQENVSSENFGFVIKYPTADNLRFKTVACCLVLNFFYKNPKLSISLIYL